MSATTIPAKTISTEEPFDWEATVLRAAALIQGELSEGEPVFWRDVNELCRDLVPHGCPKLAKEIAWKALTTHLTQLPVVWGGEKGSRWVALPPEESAVIAGAACPKCEAMPGDPCRGRSRKLSHPHADRARELFAQIG